MAGMMDDLMRTQYGSAQTAFARRQQGAGLPDNQLPAPGLPNQTWLLHPPGQMAPAGHFNFEPQGNGAWRIYPPGRQAPSHGPQGSYPTMPPSYDHLQSLSVDLEKQFGGGAPPPVPGPFSSAPPPAKPKPPGGIPGLS